MIKKIVFFSFILFLSILFFYQVIFAKEDKHQKQVIKIKRIKIIFNGEFYIWDKKSQDLPFDKNRTFNLNMIKTLINIYPSKKIEVNILDSELFIARKSLIETGYFSSVSILIIPPKKYHDSRTIVIKLYSNFLSRYSGGKLYFIGGKDNYDGDGNYYRLIFGLNLNGYIYGDKYIKDTPLGYEVSTLYRNSIDENLFSGTEAEILHNLNFGFNLYYYYKALSFLFIGFSFDFFYSKDLDYYYDFIKHENNLQIDFLFQVGFKHFWLINKNIFGYLFFNYENILPAFTDILTFNYKIKSYLITYIELTNNILFAIKYSIGICNNNIPDYLKFDIINTTDSAIRSPQKIKFSHISQFQMLNIETRFNMILFSILPICDTQLQLFVFTDFGKCEFQILQAHGIGLRLLFLQPVNAYFTFCFGFNEEFKSKFFFYYTTAGF